MITLDLPPHISKMSDIPGNGFENGESESYFESLIDHLKASIQTYELRARLTALGMDLDGGWRPTIDGERADSSYRENSEFSYEQGSSASFIEMLSIASINQSFFIPSESNVAFPQVSIDADLLSKTIKKTSIDEQNGLVKRVINESEGGAYLDTTTQLRFALEQYKLDGDTSWVERLIGPNDLGRDNSGLAISKFGDRFYPNGGDNPLESQIQGKFASVKVVDILLIGDILQTLKNTNSDIYKGDSAIHFEEMRLQYLEYEQEIKMYAKDNGLGNITSVSVSTENGEIQFENRRNTPTSRSRKSLSYFEQISFAKTFRSPIFSSKEECDQFIHSEMSKMEKRSKRGLNPSPRNFAFINFLQHFEILEEHGLLYAEDADEDLLENQLVETINPNGISQQGIKQAPVDMKVLERRGQTDFMKPLPH